MGETTTIETLGDLIDEGMAISVHCSACDHAAEVDPGRLAGRLGRDWRFIGARLPMRCSACGSRRTTFRLVIAPAWVEGRSTGRRPPQGRQP